MCDVLSDFFFFSFCASVRLTFLTFFFLGSLTEPVKLYEASCADVEKVKNTSPSPRDCCMPGTEQRHFTSRQCRDEFRSNPTE